MSHWKLSWSAFNLECQTKPTWSSMGPPTKINFYYIKKGCHYLGTCTAQQLENYV